MKVSLPKAGKSGGNSPAEQGCWLVYIILCADGSLYTGITTNIDRRFRLHATGRGAKYFRGRQPLRVVYREDNHSRASATIREIQIKAMNRAEKVILLAACANLA